MTATLCLTLTACKGAAGTSAEAKQPVELVAHECAACGMIVREQPSPRGQLVHKDGTRQFFCSVGDMVTYLTAPSPHGHVVNTWVEVQDALANPIAHDTTNQPWKPTANATFVLGAKRPRIMGTPVLVYAGKELATKAAKQHSGRTNTWAQLRAALHKVQ